MKINNLSLPHPVLGVNDDVQQYSFKMVLFVDLQQDFITIRTQAHLDNPTLIKLINNGIAAYCVEVECPQTFFRETYLLVKPENDIRIESCRLRNKVNLAFYIVAIKKISDYQIVGANEDYGKHTFDIEKGDVLAFGGSPFFYAHKDWQSLKAVKSFMDIEKSNEENGPMHITLSNEKIIVSLSPKDYERFFFYQETDALAPVFHSSIVLPTLIYAIHEMVASQTEHEGTDWYSCLDFMRRQDEKLKKFNWGDFSQIPIIAQTILDNPINRMLTSMAELYKQGASEE